MANHPPAADVVFYDSVGTVPESDGNRLYGIAFSSGNIKVGRSRRADYRLRQHAAQSANFGASVQGCWVSSPVGLILEAEAALISGLGAESDSMSAREYFGGVTLERSAELAIKAIESAVARPSGQTLTDELTRMAVRAAITDSGKTIKQVSAESGVDWAKIYVTFRGERDFRLHEVVAIAAALRVDPRSLVTFDRPSETTAGRLGAYISAMTRDELTVDALCVIAEALGVPAERFLLETSGAVSA